MPSEEIGSAYATVGFKTDESGLNSAKSKFSSALGDMESKAKSVGSAIGGALKTGLEVGAVAAAGVATAGVKTFMDIESAAADAASKMDLSAIAQKSGTTTAEAFKGVKEHVMALADELGQLNTNAFDPTQIAAACANLAAGGFDVASASAADLQDVLALATATNYDLSASAGMAMSTMNQFGMTVQDMGHISDVYATAAGKSAASMTDFDYAMQQAGPVAKGVGMSFEELTARISKLADAGYSGEKSGTALRTAMMALSSPTKTQAETLEKLGISYDQIDPRVHSFGDTLDLLMSKGADIYDFGEIFGKEGAAIVYSSAQQSAGVKELTAQLQNCDGAAGEMAKNMLDTLKGSLDAAMGAASSLAYKVGGDLAPTLKSALDWFSASGAPAVREFIGAIEQGDWGKVGDLLAEGVQAGWQKVEATAGQLLDALKSVDWSAVGQYLYEGVRAGWNELMSIGSELLDALVSVDWGSVGSALLDAMSSAIRSVIETAGGIYSYFADIDWGSVAGDLKDAFISAVDALSDIGSTILDYLTSIDWAGAGDALSDAFNSAVETLSDIGQQIWDYIGSIDWGTAGYKVADAIRNAITTLSDIGSTIWNYLTSADWSGAGSSITEKIRSGLETLSKYWEEFKAGFLTVDWAGTASEVATKIKDAWKKISDWASGIIDGLKKEWQSWIDGGGPKTLGSDLAAAIAKGAYDLGKWIYDNIESYFSTNGPSLRSAISSAIDFAKLALQTAYDFVTGFANTVLTAGKGTIGAAILEIIGGAMNSAWDGAGDGLITKAKEWRKDAEDIFSSDDFDVDVKTTYTGAGNPKDLDGSEISVTVNYKSATGESLSPIVSSSGTISLSYFGTGESISASDYSLKSSASGLTVPVTDWAKQMGLAGASFAEVLVQLDKMRVGSTGVLSQSLKDEIMGAFTEGQDEYNKAHSGEAQVEASEKAAKNAVEASEEAAENTVEASEEAADTTTAAAEVAAAAGKSIAEALTTSTEKYLIGSQAAADAIKLGGGAVKVGLGTAGEEIAIIGRVAQQQWTDAGNSLYSKVIVSSEGWVGAVEKTTISVSNSWAEAANAAVEKSQTASSNYATAFEKAGISWKDTAESTSKATMEELSSGVSKLTFKIAESSDDFKGGISTSKSTWQYGVSGSVSTWQSSVGNSGATLKTGASSASSSMSSGGTSAKTSLVSGGASAASAIANAVNSWSSQSWNYYGYAEGTVTSGPQMAVIGEDGPTNPEYVIPTKTKRWDLLYAAMRSYGLKGFAEGTTTETGGSSGDAAAAADPDAMAAYFSITGLASMSKQVQRIINNLKDFFRLSWAIIESEGATYWKEIEKVLVGEITTIRDGMWLALLDIRNTAIAGDAAILADATATWAAYWPTIEPYMADVSENTTQDIADMKEDIASQIDEMITGTESQMAAFEKKWKEIWAQLIVDLNSAKSEITALVNDIAALLQQISVSINASINVYDSGGSSGGGGSSGSDWLADDDFTIGCGIKLNSLSSGSGSATGYYQLPPVFGGGGYYYAAKGALLDEGQQTIIAGETGPELVLPTNLTKMFLSLADAGLGQGAKAQSLGNIVIEDHTVHEHYWDGKKVAGLVMTEAIKKLQLKGMKSVS